MKNQQSPVLQSFPAKFGIALNRVLWWERLEMLGNSVLVITFDNKEKLTLSNEQQIREAEEFFAGLNAPES